MAAIRQLTIIDWNAILNKLHSDKHDALFQLARQALFQGLNDRNCLIHGLDEVKVMYGYGSASEEQFYSAFTEDLKVLLLDDEFVRATVGSEDGFLPVLDSQDNEVLGQNHAVNLFFGKDDYLLHIVVSEQEHMPLADEFMRINGRTFLD